MSNPSTLVLLVDGDDENREAMMRILVNEGFDVRATASGDAALELARADTPSVMVVNLLLPDSGGLGVARRVRREHPDRAIPALFVSGRDAPVILDALSAAPVIYSPFNDEDLVRYVRALARGAGGSLPEPVVS